MKKYIKDGKIKTRNQIIIIKDGMQIINPSEELILSDGWIEYVPQINEPSIETLKKIKIDEVLRYDSSDSVNTFFMNDIKIWLDKSTRTGLMLRLQSEQLIHKTETTLWYDNVMYTLPLLDAFNILYALEIYASECYDNTQQHIANISKLNTKEEIEAYDYRVGYPDYLRF